MYSVSRKKRDKVKESYRIIIKRENGSCALFRGIFELLLLPTTTSFQDIMVLRKICNVSQIKNGNKKKRKERARGKIY